MKKPLPLSVVLFKLNVLRLMRKSLFFCLFIVFTSCVMAQEVAVFEKNNLFGLKDARNKTIIKATYDYIYPLNDNYFLIEKEKKIGLVNKTGKLLFSPVYEDVQNFGDGSFMVLSNNKWGIISKSNQIILPPEYTGFEQVTEYLYVTRLGNKKGLMNKFGDIMMPAKYDDISKLSDNLFLMKKGLNVGVIDDLGNVVIPEHYHSLEKINAFNLYKVGVKGKWGIIDLSGKVIVEPVLDEIDYSAPNYILVKQNGKYGFIINRQYISASYDKIIFTQPELGVIVVRKGELKGFVTIYGLVIPPIYDNISRFSPNGYALVEKRGKLMFVDITGKERTLQEVRGHVQY